MGASLLLEHFQDGSCLKAIRPITVHGGELNPHEFFQNRKGLFVCEGFRDLVLRSTPKEPVVYDGTVLGYADLWEGAYEPKICVDLPEGYVFKYVERILGHIATFITQQWEGKRGVLLHNGNSNNFFINACDSEILVAVSRLKEEFGWGCFAYRKNASRCRVAARVFSAVIA